jgi:thiamine pyrophosphokinase
MKTSALIANGEILDLSIIKSLLKSYSRIVAVDGGLKQCKAALHCPSLIVGDFDSVSKKLLDEYSVPKIKLKKEKDETDLEIAIQHEINIGIDRITIFGGWGGRIDHSLTNALLLTRFPNRVRMETETEILFAIQGDSKIHCKKGQTLSLLPICGPVFGITTKGLKWELENKTLDHQFIGISNICLQEEISILIQEGILICSIVKD